MGEVKGSFSYVILWNYNSYTNQSLQGKLGAFEIESKEGQNMDRDSGLV